MAHSADTLTDLNPRVEKLKRELEAKQAQIMEVGGANYRHLKEELDQIVSRVVDTERTLNKNKHTVSNSSGSLRKLDQEIARGVEDIEKLNQAKQKLQEEIEKNEVAGNKLLVDSQACQKVKEDCQRQLEEKKNDFMKMKNEMAEIDALENQLKEDLDRMLKERQICKEKCDRIKTNIRTNRQKFAKNIEEYGEDGDLNEEADSLDANNEERVEAPPPRESTHRTSVAPLQADQ